MSKFALVKIEAVKGKQNFYKLVKDGTCEFDEFEEEARVNFNLEMNTIYRRMDAISLGKRLPIEQCRVLKDIVKGITSCEIKTKRLRVYFFIDKISGNIVITGGFKTKQKKDINHFRNIIMEYLDSKGEIK